MTVSLQNTSTHYTKEVEGTEGFISFPQIVSEIRNVYVENDNVYFSNTLAGLDIVPDGQTKSVDGARFFHLNGTVNSYPLASDGVYFKSQSGVSVKIWLVGVI